MLESQLNRIKGKGRKRDVIHISESESDDELPPSKKGKHIPVQLDQLTLEMKGIRKDISSVLTLSKGMKLPPGLHTLLHDTFKCNICQSSPIRPPVMFTHCCKSILYRMRKVCRQLVLVGKMDDQKSALCAGRNVPSQKQYAFMDWMTS